MNYEFKTKRFRIQNNSGASLLFVLAVTFLLIAVGTSVLVAAGAGRGAMARQAEHNQLMLLEESIQGTIMRSLQSPEENALGPQIIWAMFEARLDESRLGDTIELTGMEFDNEEFDEEVSEMIDHIRLTILQQNVQINEAVPAVFTETFQGEEGNWDLDPDGLPISTGWEVTESRVPRTAIVAVRLVVEVEITVGGRTITSEAEHIFIGDEFGLTDTNPAHEECIHPACLTTCTGIFTENTRHGMRMFNGGGQWTLERRGVMISGIDEPTAED